MRLKGAVESSPGSLRQRLFNEYLGLDDAQRDATAATEARLADLDFACQEATGYAAEALGALDRAMTEVVADNEGPLEALREEELAALEVAQDLLAG